MRTVFLVIAVLGACTALACQSVPISTPPPTPEPRRTYSHVEEIDDWTLVHTVIERTNEASVSMVASAADRSTFLVEDGFYLLGGRAFAELRIICERSIDSSRQPQARTYMRGLDGGILNEDKDSERYGFYEFIDLLDKVAGYDANNDAQFVAVSSLISSRSEHAAYLYIDKWGVARLAHTAGLAKAGVSLWEVYEDPRLSSQDLVISAYSDEGTALRDYFARFVIVRRDYVMELRHPDYVNGNINHAELTFPVKGSDKAMAALRERCNAPQVIDDLANQYGGDVSEMG